MSLAEGLRKVSAREHDVVWRKGFDAVATVPLGGVEGVVRLADQRGGVHSFRRRDRGDPEAACNLDPTLRNVKGSGGDGGANLFGAHACAGQVTAGQDYQEFFSA